MNEDQFFQFGIKRDPGTLVIPPEGDVVNLGSGYTLMLGAFNLDRPDWEAPHLVFENDSVAQVHMHHFLEHLDVDTALAQLREVERVLMPGGVAYITVPHAMVPLAYQAPDHRSYWTEAGFQDTFYSAGYDSAYGKPWKLDIAWMKVAGVKWENLCVFVQLVKRREDIPSLRSVWDRNG